MPPRRTPALSLFARSFALIALLMLFSVLAWLGVYTHFEREPRAQQLAHWVITSVNVVRPALLNAEPSKRLALLIELARKDDIRIYPLQPEDVLEPLPASPLIDSLTAKIRAGLAANTRFAGSVEGTPGFWVSFAIHEGDEYWLRLPMDHVLPPISRAWLGWAAASLLLALASAWAAVAYLTRPLGRLSHAARAVARGQAVPLLDERGPPEIAGVSQAFNHMAQTLATVEADRALSLAGISHDLRTPLTRLRLELELCALDEATRQAMIADLGDMDNIIGQFIDYARGSDDEPRQDIALLPLLEELAERFGHRGADITLEAATLPDINGKPLALRRALSNLLQNALQYAGAEHPITLAARSLPDQIEIEVRDRGPGVDTGALENLKRAFVRGDAARSNASGSGLGLAIVERIARDHGGTLQLLPREGGGLVARMTLPSTNHEA
jgi:two-component system osmolarity sensor histidine kinase EnvZ